MRADRSFVFRFFRRNWGVVLKGWRNGKTVEWASYCCTCVVGLISIRSMRWWKVMMDARAFEIYYVAVAVNALITSQFHIGRECDDDDDNDDDDDDDDDDEGGINIKEVVTKWWPIIINNLISFLCYSSPAELQLCFFTTRASGDTRRCRRPLGGTGRHRRSFSEKGAETTQKQVCTCLSCHFLIVPASFMYIYVSFTSDCDAIFLHNWDTLFEFSCGYCFICCIANLKVVRKLLIFFQFILLKSLVLLRVNLYWNNTNKSNNSSKNKFFDAYLAPLPCI